ncbi:MAG TPA: DUF3152 domain-containing protein, partial [Rugosimonospora sp.]
APIPTQARPPQIPTQARPPIPAPGWQPATQGAPGQPETPSGPEVVPDVDTAAGAEPMTRSRQRALARARSRQRHRRLLALGILLAAVALIGVDLLDGPHIIGGPARPPRHSAAAKPTTPTSSVAVPQSGPGTFAYAAGTGPVIGTAGTVRKYRVAVENGTGQDPAAFAAIAQQTLADPRGWVKGGDVRFQQVAQGATAEFTLYLATPATSEKMCGQGGIHTQQLISCRVPGQVIINLARWVNAVPGFGAPVATYQQFTLNHEIGRELGHANEACPAPGALSPVMQEQTLGLDGCVANAWPYVNGVRYSGPVMP